MFPCKLFLIGLVISFGGSFHIGYLTFLLNPSREAFYPFLHESFRAHYNQWLSTNQYRFLWSIFTTVLPLGAAVGALLIGPLSNGLGPKRAFYVSSCILLTSNAVCVVSFPCRSFELYMFGRFLAGFGSALPIGFQAVYFAEISPKQIRGILNSITGAVAYFGAVVASVVALPSVVGQPHSWPFLHLIDSIPTILLLITLPFLHESPKWLLANGYLSDARSSLRFFQASKQVDVDYGIVEIRRELAMLDHSANLFQLLLRRLLRKSVLLGCLISFVTGYSGSYALGYYATDLLAESGFDKSSATYANIFVAFSVFAGTFCSIFIIDRVGRRPLLLTGLFSCALINIVTMVLLFLRQNFSLVWIPYAVTIAMACIVFITGIGTIQVSLFIAAELVPQRARAASQSAAVVVRYLCQFSSGFLFYWLEGLVGPLAFLLFVLPLLVCGLILYRYLPETKGKSVDQIWKSSADS